MIFTDFEDGDEESRALMTSICRYNSLYAQNRSVLFTKFGSLLRESPLLFRRFLSFASNPRNFVLCFKLLQLLILGIVYLLSPFDLLPEAVYGFIGYLDDLVVVMVIVLYIAYGYSNIIEQVARDRLAAF
jgi:RING finger protein 170